MSIAGSGLPVVAEFLHRTSAKDVNSYLLEVIFLYIYHLLGLEAVSINKLSLGAIHCVRDLTLPRPRVILNCQQLHCTVIVKYLVLSIQSKT